MQDTTDLLQIKIDNAKKQLSKETLDAIASVPWQAEILKMRETKGYTFEQLGDLELETELVLCGLVSSESYPKELENRMRLSKIQVNELLNEMNKQVFSKIKEELIKNTKEGGDTNNTEEEKTNTQVLKSAGIEIVPEKLELTTPATRSILTQKLSGTVKNEVVRTEHSLENITKSPNINSSEVVKSLKIDPYREIPE